MLIWTYGVSAMSGSCYGAKWFGGMTPAMVLLFSFVGTFGIFFEPCERYPMLGMAHFS